MCAFVDHLLLHSGKPVEDDGARTPTDVVQGGIHEHSARGHGDGQPVDIVEAVGCHGCAGSWKAVVVRRWDNRQELKMMSEVGGCRIGTSVSG